MDIDQFKIILALTRPYYKFEAYVAGRGPVARIVYDNDAPDRAACIRELVKDGSYVYFAYGDTIEDATSKVIKQWTTKK